MLFGAPLTDYADAFTPNAPDHYLFGGWYADEACSVPFDFGGSMPSGDVIVYAKWTPVEFRVEIDPNGAEIDHVNHQAPAAFRHDPAGSYRQDQATYFNADYNESISEYTLARNYVPMSDAVAEAYAAEGGTVYYYLNMQYQTTDGRSIPADLRNALYITEDEVSEYYEFYRATIEAKKAEEPEKYAATQLLGPAAWREIYVSAQKYREKFTAEHYEFLGWYRVLYDDEGNETGVSSMPYDFADPVTEPMKLRAYWRLDGGYRVLYTPEYIMGDGTVINGQMYMDQWEDPAAPGANYADGADTAALQQPTGITANGFDTDEFIFRGWRVVSLTSGGAYTPLEPEVFYQPGDGFTINAAYADRSGIIRMQAVYEQRSESYRRPAVANLTLDPNSGFITDDGETALGESMNLPWEGPGTVLLDADARQLVFGDIQSNAAVHLYRYAAGLTTDAAGEPLDPAGEPLDPAGTNHFAHSSGYRLLGFDDAPDEQDFVASYPADSVIAVQRTDRRTLYAVWEPMVYLNIVNATRDTENGSEGGALTLSLSSTDGAALYVVNMKDGDFARIPITDKTDITVEEGQTLRLAIPNGKDRDVTISGVNGIGTGILLYWQGELDGETVGHAHGEAKNGESFDVTETLAEDEEGVTVTFRSLEADYTLVLDDNYPGASRAEVYFSNNPADANYVRSAYTLPSTRTRLGYEFIGWAETEESAAAGTADYSNEDGTIGDMESDFFIPLDQDDDQIVTLYAVWKARADANTVYVYNAVPAPGDPAKAFEFTIALSAYFRRGNASYGSEKSAHNTYSITGDQYLKIVTMQNNGSATEDAEIRVTVEKYNIGEEDPVDTADIMTLTWPSGGETGTFQSFSMSVTETDYSAAPHYYDTDLELAAYSAENPLRQESDLAVAWSASSAGGTVIFTNTRQTADVTVRKEVVGPAAVAAFTFGGSYTADGVTTALEDFTVVSGSETGTTLEKIPVGAVLTVAEKGTDLNDYTTAVTRGETELAVTEESSESEGVTAYTRQITLDVTEDTGVTFTNTLKSFPVKIVKVGYDGATTTQDVEAQFTLSAGLSNVFAGRYTTPGNNVVFESGVSYAGGDEDPVLYVGEYTLTEDRVWGGYLGLTGPVTITVDGDGVHLPEGVKGAASEKDGDVLTFTNTKKTVTITVRKTVTAEDKTGSFDFVATLTGNGAIAGYVIRTAGDESYVTNDAGQYFFSLADGGAAELTVPVGARLTVREYGGRDAADAALSMDAYVTAAAAALTAGGAYGGGTSYDEDARLFTLAAAPSTPLTVTFTNGSSGKDVRFKKVDGYGNALGGAGFTLYAEYACLTPVTITVNDEAAASVLSADSFETADGVEYNTAFRVPPDVYYMKETGAAAAGITLPEGAEFLIQRMSGAATADAVPVIAEAGIVNLSLRGRKVIIRAVDQDTYAPISGAQFHIYLVDDSEYTEYQQEDMGLYESGAAGAYFIGMLPYGIYHIHETRVTPGYDDNDDQGWWYTLTIHDDGSRELVGPLTEKPASS